MEAVKKKAEDQAKDVAERAAKKKAEEEAEKPAEEQAEEKAEIATEEQAEENADVKTKEQAKEEIAAAKDTANREVDKKSSAREGTRKKVTSGKAAPRTISLWPMLILPILLAMSLQHLNMHQEPCSAVSRCTAPRTTWEGPSPRSPPWPPSRSDHPPSPWTPRITRWTFTSPQL